MIMEAAHKQKIVDLQKKGWTNPGGITSALMQFHGLQGDYRVNRANVIKEMQRNDGNPNQVDCGESQAENLLDNLHSRF